MPPIALVPRSCRVQLILEKISTPEVLMVDDLDESDRGDSGFGSTGVSGSPPPPSEPIA